MQWQAEWGDSLDFLYDLEARGINPKALENRPVQYDWMTEYLQAFRCLNRTRTNGMAPNPISLVEISTYLELYGAYDPAAFVEHIQAMDAAWLKAKAAKKPQEVQPPSLESGRSRHGRSNQQQRRPTGSNSR